MRENLNLEERQRRAQILKNIRKQGLTFKQHEGPVQGSRDIAVLTKNGIYVASIRCIRDMFTHAIFNTIESSDYYKVTGFKNIFSTVSKFKSLVDTYIKQ